MRCVDVSKVEARCSHYIGKCGGEPVEGSVLCADEIGKISPSEHAQFLWRCDLIISAAL